MTCVRCQRELRDDSTFCSFCGVRLAGGPAAGGSAARLTRSRSERKVAGVCGGLAEYLRIDPSLVRAAWIILSVLPGFVVGGVVVYLVAWLIVPDAGNPVARDTQPRQLRRSVADRRAAGVCGGLAEYFGVDATPVRLLWVILSVVPGAVIGGLAVYAVAWFVMPAGFDHHTQPAPILV
jgi:phage shock protein C